MIADRFIPYQKSQMYAKFTQLANKHGCVNLGQGFPNFEPPAFLRQFLAEEIMTQPFQYTQCHGHQQLLEAISRFYKQKINYEPDPNTEICVSQGATATLTCCFQGLCNAGDEVLVLDPAFDFYRPLIQFAQAKPFGIPIIAPHKNSKENLWSRFKDGKFIYDEHLDRWELDYKFLEEKLNDKTKILLINSPLNPSGKVFCKDELDRIADILEKYPQVIVLEDAAYQHVTFGEFEPFNYPRPITHDRLKSRTVCVSSAGKLFSATGHRVGFAFGPKELIKGVKLAQTYHIFCLSGYSQTATAKCFDLCLQNTFFKDTRDLYEQQSQMLLKGLVESRFKFNYWVPNGGYFIVTDISEIDIPEKYFICEEDGSRLTRDFAFAHYMVHEVGVVCIPCSPYYDNKELGQNLVRWAFCKTSESIQEACKRLK